MNYDQFLNSAQSALTVVEVFLTKQEISSLTPDHLCYKCSSHNEFLEVRAILEKESMYLYESWISTRLIAVLKLKKPIVTSFGIISFIELQDKKEGSGSLSGFTHIEFYPKDGNYDAALATLVSRGLNIISDPTPHHPIHEILLTDSFVFRLEHEPVIEKIKREEL
jgi:predicted metalloenzyme YecM